MLCGEITAVYCENHIEHMNETCGHNAEIRDVTACPRYVQLIISAIL